MPQRQCGATEHGGRDSARRGGLEARRPRTEHSDLLELVQPHGRHLIPASRRPRALAPHASVPPPRAEVVKGRRRPQSAVCACVASGLLPSPGQPLGSAVRQGHRGTAELNAASARLRPAAPAHLARVAPDPRLQLSIGGCPPHFPHGESSLYVHFLIYSYSLYSNQPAPLPV
eukprot:SAG22_NODE_19_length_32182_cov_39.206963_10_plen_173_part_00